MKTFLATGKMILLLATLQRSKSVTFSPQVVCRIKKAVLADGKLSLHEDKLFAGGKWKYFAVCQTCEYWKENLSSYMNTQNRSYSLIEF